jgi:DNA-binding CsgD family transcriptional regulator
MEIPMLLGLSYSFLGIIGALLFAFYLITHWTIWFFVLQKYSITIAVVFVLLSAALGYFFTWFLLGIEGVRSVWALLIAVILSMVMLLSNLRRLPQANKVSEATKRFTRMPLGFELMTFAFSVSYMYAVNINGLEDFHSTFSWSLLVFSLALLAIVLILRKWITLGTLFSLAAPLMIIGLLITSFTEFNHVLLFNLFNFGFFTYLVFVVLLYCGFVKEQGGNGLRSACLVILSIFVGCFVGRQLFWVVEHTFAQQVHYYQTLVSLLIICVLIVCMMACLRNTYRLFGNFMQNPGSELISHYEKKGLSCEQVAETFGLSERETEVLGLLLEGKSATQISEEMVIAHGTVKAHIRNIYKKVDIHRREELFEIADT